MIDLKEMRKQLLEKREAYVFDKPFPTLKEIAGGFPYKYLEILVSETEEPEGAGFAMMKLARLKDALQTEFGSMEVLSVMAFKDTHTVSVMFLAPKREKSA